MKTYRCFFFSGERIQSVQVLECEDDNEASTKGAMILESKPEHQCVEIWQGARLLVRVPRSNAQQASHKVIRLVPKTQLSCLGSLLAPHTYESGWKPTSARTTEAHRSEAGVLGEDSI